MFCSNPCRVKWLNDYWNPLKPRKTNRRHGTEARKQDFTDIQKQIVLWTLLGDSCIIQAPSGRCRLSITHDPKQLEWMQWKKDQLAFVFHREKPTPCKNKNGDMFYGISSVWHPYFNEMHALFYQRDGKRIPKTVIDNMPPLTLAVWYMDDGSWNSNPKSRQVVISTNDYPCEDVEYAREALQNDTA